MIGFEGKKILILGASSGIGRQTAILLDQLGASVILVARRKEELLAVKNTCKGEKVITFPFDLSNIEKISTLFDEITQCAGKLSGMVFSAGINEDIPIGSLNYDKMLRTFRINYFAFVECVRQATKRSRYEDGFRIVGVSSVSSMQGEKAHCAYAGSKAAMDGSIRVLAKELSTKGICINSVAPGMIQTKMTEDFLIGNDKESDAYLRTMRRQYLGMGKPEDVANTICFLLSSAARLITGITIPVDGGFSTSC